MARQGQDARFVPGVLPCAKILALFPVLVLQVAHQEKEVRLVAGVFGSNTRPEAQL